MDMRLMNDMEDYQRLGLNPKKVEDWEAQRRSPRARNAWEAWTVGATLDDGTLLDITYATKDPAHIGSADDTPVIDMTLTGPDGTVTHATRSIDADRCTFGEGGLDLGFDDCRARGDLRSLRLTATDLTLDSDNTSAISDEAADNQAADGEDTTAGETNDENDAHYRIHGTGFDLRLDTQARPLRPATGIFDYGHDARSCVGWLSPMPVATISGTIVIDGTARHVTGHARHTHEWGTIAPSDAWNHVLTVTQRFHGMTLTLVDITGAHRTGYIRYPMVFLTNERGILAYSDTLDTHCHSTVTGTATAGDDDGAPYPNGITYTFDTPDNGTITYALADAEPLGDAATLRYATGAFGLKKHHIDTIRLTGTGTLTITEPQGARGRHAIVSHGTVVQSDDTPDTADTTVDSYDDPSLHATTTTYKGPAVATFRITGKQFDVRHAPQIVTEYVY